MDQYIRYHKRPFAKYLDVKAFNEKFGTSIPDVENYDAYFQYTFNNARKMQGPSEFLLAKFVKQDQFDEMGYFGDKMKEARKAAKKAYAVGKAALKGKKAVEKELKKAAPAKPDKKPGKVKPEVNDLDELLGEEENLVEEEYDEDSETKTAASPEPQVKNIVTEKKKIADMVKKASKDSDEYHQDMKHLIRFKSTKFPLEEQLMKGRPKYLKALRAYLKGDKSAEVKMSWRKKKKMVRVADLNPKRDSLKALLRSSAGNIRVVECV